MKISIISVLVALVMVFVGCGGAESELDSEVGSVSISARVGTPDLSAARGPQRATIIDLGSVVERGVVRLSRGGLVKYVTMTIAGDSASATATSLLVGFWRADIQLYDATGTIVYSGSASFTVQNSTASSNVTVSLARHQGSAIFEFDLPHEYTELDSGLVFWNKMGSLSEMQNSMVGPALIPGTAGTYVEGRFGGAVHNVRAGARTERARIPSGLVYLDSFAVEFWIKKDSGVVNGLGSMITMNENGQVMHIQQRAGYAGAYRTFVEIGAGGSTILYQIEHGTLAGCDEFLPPNVWVHLAVSVNSSNPAGERIRLYRNGVLQSMSVAQDAILPHALLNGNPYILASWAWDNDGFDGSMDNLKFYNYAKTDFIPDFEY